MMTSVVYSTVRSWSLWAAFVVSSYCSRAHRVFLRLLVQAFEEDLVSLTFVSVYVRFPHVMSKHSGADVACRCENKLMLTKLRMKLHSVWSSLLDDLTPLLFTWPSLTSCCETWSVYIDSSSDCFLLWRISCFYICECDRYETCNNPKPECFSTFE